MNVCDYCEQPDTEFDLWTRVGVVVKRKCLSRCADRPFIELTSRILEGA